MSDVFSYRLKFARLQLGLTQEELAHAIGVSKQLISQYEKGVKKPQSSTLLALSRYFKKPSGFFLQPPQAELGNVSFRKRSRLMGRALESVKYTILNKLEPYLEVEELLNARRAFKNPLEHLLVHEPADAERAAIQLLDLWELGTNPIPNIAEMLEDKGIKVVFVKADSKFDGLCTLVNDEIPVLAVNDHIDVLRKRFTILHELGHLLLKFPEHSSEQEREKACNRFAGALLLPAQVLEEEIGTRRHHVSLKELIALKTYYGISIAAVVYRGLELGIFSEQFGKRFWKLRNQNPELKMETSFGDYKGEEQSNRFQQLLSKALALELISQSKAAQMAGISLQELRDEYQVV